MESGLGIERRAARARVLVVDDDGLMRSFLEQALTRMGLTVQTEPSAEAALEAAGAFAPDLALLDVRLGGMDGITLLGRLATAVPDCNCIVMTAHGTIETAIRAMKTGASDFLVKPFTVDALEVVVEKALGVARLKRENKRLRARLRRRSGAPYIVGKSRVMLQLQDLVRTVARSPATVLIEGESGTGKELIAQALHVWGPREKGPFVKVNCAALPDGLMESELFGHDRGAFTGATGMLRGKFELADGGSLLLDEISEMEFVLQPKLLRSIQEKEFYRVGGSQPIRVDVRILATTNADLVDRMRAGMFREDLYYRLRVVPIQVPALRDRRDDIALLAQHFLQTAAAENGKLFDGIHKEAIAGLMNHNWPGNVRELENMIQRAVVICPEAIIGPEHLLWDTPAMPADRPAASATTADPRTTDPRAAHSEHLAMAAGHALTVRATGPRADGAAPPVLPDIPLRELERLWILRTLQEEGGNKSRTARRLGISVRTIRNKLREWEDASDAKASALS